MQQIAEWLEKLGMSEYAQRFAENDVDISVLPHLTDHDLKELGAAPDARHYYRSPAQHRALAGCRLPLMIRFLPLPVEPTPVDPIQRW
jgi:SAM domain (Sterile alpha motif)